MNNNSKNKINDTIIDEIRNLYNTKNYTLVIQKAQQIMKEHGDSFIFWNFIGAANLNLGMFEEALEAFYEVITLNPQLPSGYNNYGYTFLKLGKMEKAIENFYKAISINNEYDEAYINLGIAYKEKGENEVAIQNYKKLLAFRPNNEKAYNNLGVIYREEKMFDKASKAFLTAVTLKPNYYEAFLNLGILYLSQGEFKKAIDYLKKTLSINPSSYEAFNNLGGAYYQNGEPNKAIKFFNEALNLKPDSEDIFAKKIHQHAIICDWDPIKKNQSLFRKVGTTDQSISPFSLLSIEDAPERHKKRSEIFRKHYFPDVPLLLEKKSKKNNEIIHIGYFSSDFREHPVAYLLVGVLQKHNRKNFKIYGYSIDQACEDEFSKKIINLFDVFHNVKYMSNKEITMLARSDEIDIAIDLNGYTQYSRTEIFAYRAAPIQINYLGYPGTLGAEFIDYIVADKNLIPKKSQKFYSEKPIYLPNSYMPTDNKRKVSNKSITKSDMGLPEDSFVFCCFNNNFKITCEEFDIWMRLLGKVKNGVLWLRKSNEWSQDNFKKEAIKRYIDPSRIIFAEQIDIEVHLSRYKLADLFLDTFNFNAHTTATEALWVGLPVVTKIGRGFPARVASSLLYAINCPELITKTKEEYEELILALVNNPTKLKKIREKIQKNRMSAPLFDTKLYTKNLESAFSAVYHNFITRNSPKIINI